jgi:hypothetical protein
VSLLAAKAGPGETKRLLDPTLPPGGLVFNRAPALLRRSVCAFRTLRPKPRLPEKSQELPCGRPARVVAVPTPHPWRTEGEGLDEVARRALLEFISAPQVFLDSGVGGAGADEGQAHVNRSEIRGNRAMPPPPSAAGCGASRKPPRICCRGQSPSRGG